MKHYIMAGSYTMANRLVMIGARALMMVIVLAMGGRTTCTLAIDKSRHTGHGALTA